MGTSKLIRLIMLAIFALIASNVASAAELLSTYEGKSVKQVIKKIGNPDHVADEANGIKIYTWQQTRASLDYAGENKPGGLVKSGQTNCVAQFLVDANGKVLRGVMDGEVLACATLKKKMSLI